jgi:hypothetical protein
MAVPKKYKSKKRVVILPKDSVFDKIFAHYTTDYKLSAVEERIMHRWREAWTLLVNYNGMEQAIIIHAQNHGISERHARRDINDAVRLFGSTTQLNKNADRYLIYQYCMHVFNAAKAAGDITEMNRAITNMIKITGIDKEDPEKIDWTKVEQHEIRISVPKDVMLALKNMTMRGALDMDDVLDIDHEDA